MEYVWKLLPNPVKIQCGCNLIYWKYRQNIFETKLVAMQLAEMWSLMAMLQGDRTKYIFY